MKYKALGFSFEILLGPSVLFCFSLSSSQFSSQSMSFHISDVHKMTYLKKITVYTTPLPETQIVGYNALLTGDKASASQKDTFQLWSGDCIVICIISVVLTKTVKMPLSKEMNPFLPKGMMTLLLFDLCSDFQEKTILHSAWCFLLNPFSSFLVVHNKKHQDLPHILKQ